MLRKLMKSIHGGQKGITGLETAIILIAFVVVAAVFAYTVLSAGLFSTQKSQEAVYNGIKQTESTLEIKGDVLATADQVGASGVLQTLTFTVTNVAGGDPIDLTLPPNNVTTISYIDATQKVQDLSWTEAFIGNNNGDEMLDPGEKCQLTVSLSKLTTAVGINQTFTIEVKTADGATYSFERTTPATMGLVNDLH